MATNIYIALPAYGGSVKTACAMSLLGLQRAFTKAGIGSIVAPTDSAFIDDTRNVLATRFLTSDCTHLLFVDHDIGFKPEAPLRLIAANKPLIGCIYPQRKLDLDKVVELAKSGLTLPNILARASVFPVHWTDQSQIQVTDGIASVIGIPMGLCLIAREVFDVMIASGSIRHDKSNEHRPPDWLWGFFDRERDGDHILPEDYSFCRRYRNLGGEVFAMVSERVDHIGEMTFSAVLTDRYLPKEEA